MSSNTLHLLYVDSDTGNSRRLHSQLQSLRDREYCVHPVNDGQACLHRLSQAHFDAVVIDWQQRSCVTPSFLRRIRGQGHGGPIIARIEPDGQAAVAHLMAGGFDGWIPTTAAGQHTLQEALQSAWERASRELRDRWHIEPQAEEAEDVTAELQTFEHVPVILAIEDDAGDAELLKRCLGEIPDFEFEFVHCLQIDDALDALRSTDMAAVFVDYQLGARTGLDALKAMRASGYLGPAIVLTGQGDECVAATLMRNGADDYVIKGDLTPDALRRSISAAQSRHRKREYEAHNRHLLAEMHGLTQKLEKKNRRLAELYETAYRFVDNVSHEFRTPLTVIKEFATIMVEGLAGQPTPEQQEYLGILLTRVDELSTMVNDMLDISKLEAGLLGVRRQPTHVSEISEHVATTLAREAERVGARLEAEYPPDIPTVFCDREKIGRVLINLVVNALKHSAVDDVVRVRARQDPQTRVVWFEVVDNGPGIAPDKLEAIFDRFEQVGGNLRASTSGFGLGLDIARELVHFNLGDITVKSELGTGSVFAFSIPPCDPWIIVQRYLRFHQQHTEGCNLVSLFEFHAADCAPRECREINGFLQEQLRRFDLLIRRTETCWLLVADADHKTAADVIQRFERSYATWRESGEPDRGSCMGIDFLGTYDPSRGQPDLLELVGHRMHREEVCTV